MKSLSRRARVVHVRELLAARIGEAAIDVLVLTHADRDHYQWIPPVLEGRELSRVIHSAQLDAYDQAGTADWLRERVPASERYALPAAHHDPVEAPSRLIDCGEIEVHVLAANIAPGSAHASSDSWRSNTGSIVLRFGRHGVPRAIAILAGDATRDTERSIVTAYANAPDFVGADLLRLGHHGSSTTSNDVAWIDAVRPRVAFSSSGHYGGALRHPRPPRAGRHPGELAQRGLPAALRPAPEAG